MAVFCAAEAFTSPAWGSGSSSTAEAKALLFNMLRQRCRIYTNRLAASACPVSRTRKTVPISGNPTKLRFLESARISRKIEPAKLPSGQVQALGNRPDLRQFPVGAPNIQNLERKFWI